MSRHWTAGGQGARDPPWPAEGPGRTPACRGTAPSVSTRPRPMGRGAALPRPRPCAALARCALPSPIGPPTPRDTIPGWHRCRVWSRPEEAGRLVELVDTWHLKCPGPCPCGFDSRSGHHLPDRIRAKARLKPRHPQGPSECSGAKSKVWATPVTRGPQPKAIAIRDRTRPLSDSTCSAACVPMAPPSHHRAGQRIRQGERSGDERPGNHRLPRKPRPAGRSTVRDEWWRGGDSNPRPCDYESHALTN